MHYMDFNDTLWSITMQTLTIGNLVTHIELVYSDKGMS